MKNEIGGMKEGIKARLESIPGLRVITYQPEDWRDFPVAVIRTESRGGARVGADGARRFDAEFVVTLMAGGAKRREAYAALDAYIASEGAMSVEAALDGDPTLDGAAERAYLAGVENVRVARLGGGRYAGADFRIRVERRTLPVRPTATVASATLSNETDGANRNYVDITDVPGKFGAAAQIRISDPSGSWSGSGKIWVGKRSGAGRADNLFFQGESGAIVKGGTIFDESGGMWSGSAQPLSHASGGQYARMAWSKAGRYTTKSEFTLCGYVRLTIAASALPRGRFRVLARARTEAGNDKLKTGKMGFGLGWSHGAKSKTPAESEAVFPPAASEFRTLDLGELTLPPMAAPEGYSTPDFKLDIYGALSGGGAGSNAGTHHFRWSVDCVTLLPIGEGEVSVSGFGASGRVLLDTLSASGPGAYSLDGSDRALGPVEFEGAPFGAGPEDTRVYVARDDSADPSGVKFGVRASLTPLAARA